MKEQVEENLSEFEKKDITENKMEEQDVVTTQPPLQMESTDSQNEKCEADGKKKNKKKGKEDKKNKKNKKKSIGENKAEIVTPG